MPTINSSLLNLNNDIVSSSDITRNTSLPSTTLNTSNFSTVANRNTLSSMQQINDIALQIANNQIQQQNRSNNSNNVNGNTFTMFITSDDIVENQKANVTSGIDTIIGTNTVTSSIVTNRMCAWDLRTNSNNIVATCVYGAKLVSSSYANYEAGSTLYESASELYKSNDNRSIEIYNNYMQYTSLLLGSGEDTFIISDTNGNTKEMTSFVAISYNRELYKDKLDPGNVTITIGTSSYIDNSNGATEDPTINQSYFSYDIIKSGSNNNQTYGIIYPSYGLILLDTSVFGSDKGVTYTSDANTGAITYTHRQITLDDIKKITNIVARSVESITSTYYFIRLKNGMYNYSNNPTFITGSLGDIKIPLFKESPTTYITTIGLYNNRQELLAVARLSNPIPKNFTTEIVLQVKLDF